MRARRASTLGQCCHCHQFLQHCWGFFCDPPYPSSSRGPRRRTHASAVRETAPLCPSASQTTAQSTITVTVAIFTTITTVPVWLSPGQVKKGFPVPLPGLSLLYVGGGWNSGSPHTESTSPQRSQLSCGLRAEAPGLSRRESSNP